jgi:hypothetical protein
LAQQEFSIFLLARPGYQRNGIEATLLTIEQVAVKTMDNCDQAAGLLAHTRPDLLLIQPAGLSRRTILEVYDRFFHDETQRVILVTEPYADKIELEHFCSCQIFEIETSDQLRQLVLERLQKQSQQGMTTGKEIRS